MSLIAKLTIAGATTIAGGGTALGILSKSSSSEQANKTPVQAQPELGKTRDQADGHSIVGSSHDLSDQADGPRSDLEVPTSTSLTHEEESTVIKQQTLPTKNLNGEGNCVVEDGWAEQVIRHLPEGSKYVTVLCKNTGDVDSSLTNWRGFLPEGLFVIDVDSYVKGDRFDINVKEENLTGSYEEDDYEAPTNQAVFSSDQFVSPSSFTGRWGNKTVLEVESDDPVFEVALTGSETVDKFYFQWLL